MYFQKFYFFNQLNYNINKFSYQIKFNIMKYNF